MIRNITPRLHILYDNQNDASDKYLNRLINDAKTQEIEVKVYDNGLTFIDECYKSDGAIILLPSKDTTTQMFLSALPQYNIDGVDPHSLKEVPCTSQAIAEMLLDTDRDKVITVIGRGRIASPLIAWLINKGHTVLVANSRTTHETLLEFIRLSDIIIGLSSENKIISESDFDKSHADIDVSDKMFIESNNNFDFKTIKKVRCGQKTTEILFNRLKYNFEQYKKEFPST